MPTFCEPEHIPYDMEKANQLRDVCAKYSGPHAAIASDILDSLLPAESPPQRTYRVPRSHNADALSERPEKEIARQSAVRNRTSASADQPPYPRDRSSSAPNINVIKDDMSFAELVLEVNGTTRA